jgi:hypothetical protein
MREGAPEIPGGDLHGYEFLPWSSIERISAEA